MKRVLIYRRGGLGDTLLTFPIVELLQREGFIIDFVGNTDYLKLLKEVKWVENIYSEIPLKLNIYNRIILFSKENFLRIPWVELVPPFPNKREHVLKHYLKSLNLKPLHSKVFPLKGYNRWNNFVVIHPGSGSPKKNAPLELFIELYLLLEQTHLKPLFVLGEAEHNLIGELKNYNVYLVEDILKFAKLLKGAKAFVGNDSGFSHLASYLDIPTLILFGPTDPLVWKPIGPKTEVIYKEFPCSPCFPKGCTAKVEKECLKTIKVEEILKALKGLKVI